VHNRAPTLQAQYVTILPKPDQNRFSEKSLLALIIEIELRRRGSEVGRAVRSKVSSTPQLFPCASLLNRIETERDG
jgi:hypothetical protein